MKAIKIKVKGSIETAGKQAGRERQQKKLNDRKRVINFDHINKYLNMNIADELASSYANQDERYDDEMPQEAHRIAKHLLLQIEIVNGKRTGVFADLKTTEVADAEKKEGGYVIRVAEGKTFRYSGYANIFLSAAEMRLMRQYIGIIRKQFHPKTDQVFRRIRRTSPP